MNRTGALYRLINTMSPSEKRYFTLLAAANRYSSDYLMMFSLIDEHQVNNDEKLKSALSAKKPFSHFAVKKIHLYQLVLKSLRNYHQGRSFDFTLKEMMLDAAILSDKALYHDCYAVLIKARGIASMYEEWKVLLEILHKEYTIMQQVILPGKLLSETERFNDEEKKVLSQLNNYSEFTYLNIGLRLAIQQAETSKEKKLMAVVRQIKRDKLLQDEKYALSFRSKSLYFLIKSTCSLCELQFEKAEEMMLKHLKLYEKHPHFIQASPGNYLNTLKELLMVHFRLRRYTEANKIIERLRLLPENSSIRKIRSNRFKILLLSWTFKIELSIAIQTATVAAALSNLKEQEEYFFRHALQIEPQTRAETFLALASCYFEVKEFKKAIQCLRKIFIDNTTSHEPMLMARMMEIIIHYEEGNSDLLDHLVLAFKRKIKKNETASGTTVLLVNIASQLSRLHPQRKNPVFSEQLKKLEMLKRDSHEQSLFDYFDITRWLKGK